MKKLNPILKILFIALRLLAIFILFLCANFIFKKFIEYNITREFLKELYGSIMYFIKHGGLVFIFTSLGWFFGNKIYNHFAWKKKIPEGYKKIIEDQYILINIKNNIIREKGADIKRLMKITDLFEGSTLSRMQAVDMILQFRKEFKGR